MKKKKKRTWKNNFIEIILEEHFKNVSKIHTVDTNELANLATDDDGAGDDNTGVFWKFKEID